MSAVADIVVDPAAQASGTPTCSVATDTGPQGTDLERFRQKKASPPKISSAAERQRRYKRRKVNSVLLSDPIELEEDLRAALVQAGAMDLAECETKAGLAAAIKRILRERERERGHVQRLAARFASILRKG